MSEADIEHPDAPGIASVRFFHQYREDLEGMDKIEFYSPDAGSVEITLDNGAVLVCWTSEWGGVEYYAPGAT